MTKNTLRLGRGSAAILALSFALGCQGPVPTAQQTTPSSSTTLTGKVELGSLYGTQATLTDIVAAATVSLIDTANNKTIATGLTDPSGNFSINPDKNFNPKAGEVFVLEAVKGLRSNSAQADIARVRTIVKRTGSGYDDIDQNDSIKISVKTTAVSIASAIAAANNSSFNIAEVINKIEKGGGYVPFGPFNMDDMAAYEVMVTAALTKDRDPVLAAVVAPGHVQGFSGSGSNGSTNSSAQSSTFSSPNSITYDQAGFFYVADVGTGLIRKVDANNGSVATLNEGSAISNLRGVAFAPGGRLYYITTTTLGYQILGQNWNPTLIVTSGFSNEGGFAVDSTGNNLYIADHSAHRILKVGANHSGAIVAADILIQRLPTPDWYTSFSVAGSGGPGGTAQILQPRGVAVVGSSLYVTEYGAHRIRKVDLNKPSTDAGYVTTFAGPSGNIGDVGFDAINLTNPADANRINLRTRGTTDGKVGEATFNYPTGIVADSNKWLYVSEGSHVIRRISINAEKPEDNTVVTIAGTIGKGGFLDGAVGVGLMNNPRNMAVLNGRVYVADYSNHRIRYVRGAF